MHIGNYITTNTHDLQISKRYAEEPDAPASLLFLQIVNELMIEHALYTVSRDCPRCNVSSLYAELVVLIDAQV